MEKDNIYLISFFKDFHSIVIDYIQYEEVMKEIKTNQNYSVVKDVNKNKHFINTKNIRNIKKITTNNFKKK